MTDCVFCRVVAGEIDAAVLYRDDDVIAISDLNPQAPLHALVIPREHYPSLPDFVGSASAEGVAKIFSVASALGEKAHPGGFRLVVNTGAQGGQTVGHLHVHVLAGRQMSWPPG